MNQDPDCPFCLSEFDVRIIHENNRTLCPINTTDFPYGSKIQLDLNISTGYINNFAILFHNAM